MDIQAILQELKHERGRLNIAIEALEETDSSLATRVSSPAAMIPAPQTKRGGRLTPEGRKRLADAMKKRWAAKKKKATQKGK